MSEGPSGGVHQWSGDTQGQDEPDAQRYPTDPSEGDRIDNELGQDRVVGGADCLAGADPRVRSVTETNMMFKTPMPPTSSERAAIAGTKSVGRVMIWLNTVSREPRVCTWKSWNSGSVMWWRVERIWVISWTAAGAAAEEVVAMTSSGVATAVVGMIATDLVVGSATDFAATSFDVDGAAVCVAAVCVAAVTCRATFAAARGR